MAVHHVYFGLYSSILRMAADESANSRYVI